MTTNRSESDIRRQVLDALEPYRNKHHGRNRYNTPWRQGADGGTLAVDEDGGYGLGLKWFDHKDGESGNGITLLQKLNETLQTAIPLPSQGQVLTVKQKPVYDSLKGYAEAHGVPVEVFEAAGWHEVKRGGRNLLAFAFNTSGGMRYRYADEAKAGRKFDHEKGTSPSWYGLERAVKAAEGAPLVICNGEPSTLVAQYYGVPACAVTGGERGSMREDLVEELREVWAGDVLVAFDCDDTGRRDGPALATHLRALGVSAKAIDLGGAHGFDLADFCRLHQQGARKALAARPEIAIKAPSATPTEYIADWKAQGTTAAALQYTEFPPESWVIEGILPAGACLLAAKAKKGKSWLALQAAVCVSMGKPFIGRLPTTAGRVLYLDLEGTQRRIQKRLRAMLGATRTPWPENFHVFTEWPQGPEALSQLEAWLMAHPDTKLVIIDVLASFRRPMDMRESFYQYDRETVKPINDLLEKYDCAGILVHHMNKARVDDVFDSVSGSTGLISVTNTQWAMGANPEDRKLIIFALQGRDLHPDYTEPLGLRWNDYASMHEVEGSAAEVSVSVERKVVLDALDDDEPRTPKEIAEFVGKPVNAVRKMLGKLLDSGHVDKSGYGQYVIVRGHSGHSEHGRHSGHSEHSLETKVSESMPRMPKNAYSMPGGRHSLPGHQDAVNSPDEDKNAQNASDASVVLVVALSEIPAEELPPEQWPADLGPDDTVVTHDPSKKRPWLVVSRATGRISAGFLTKAAAESQARAYRAAQEEG